ncbi:Trm112 family protein [uncultured Aeromicrobium sp.]|uniref:Trm112 family protein n=1 Tax=uncultured Aeromicrobium sp. TaxID=337820 RepID=UPI0025E9E613|nr:Trm112 family protein [uncultured Aeromicrobium sp.]
MNLDPALLEILVCPQCRSALFVDADADELICNACALAYPVRDDIPVMLVDEARPFGDAPAATSA